MITPEPDVQDIRAGPGTFVIPFAGKVRKITAIGPSIETSEHLKKNINDIWTQFREKELKK